MIEQLVNEINGLLRDGYPYSALGIALTLPDICGNIAYPNTKVADHYKKWYSEYVNPISALKFKDGFDEEICYKLRCAYLHSGNFDLGNADAVKNINKFEILEMSRNVQSGNTQNLKSSAAPVRLPAAPASTPGTSQAAAQAGCVYRP